MAHDPETQKRLDDIMADPSYRLAYRDPDFIGSEDLRPLRLEMELLKPETVSYTHLTLPTILLV